MLDRRTFLAVSGAGVTAAMVGRTATAATFDRNPFQLGSASGDSTTDSVILWTRLAPKPTASDFGMDGQPDTIPIHWRIAETYEDVQDDATSLYSGDVDAHKKDAWSVHLEVKDAGGPLEPGKLYHYQFSLPDMSHKAWIGQTRTAPERSADVSAEFAVISCQSAATDRTGNNGPSHWHGYTHLEENPVDFVVHLGDYIYRESHENTVPADDHCTELVDYRRRWGWYLERDNIQRTRRLYSMYAVPDDHEMYNNYQGANIKPRFGEGTDWQLRAFNHGLITFWENMPVRGPRPSALDGDDKVRFPLHRVGLGWGAHLDVTLMDCRQYRTDPDAADPTLLGAEQREAVVDAIDDSEATWTVLGTAGPLSVYYAKAGVPTNPVNWTAYPPERRTDHRRVGRSRRGRRKPGGVGRGRALSVRIEGGPARRRRQRRLRGHGVFRAADVELYRDGLAVTSRRQPQRHRVDGSSRRFNDVPAAATVERIFAVHGDRRDVPRELHRYDADRVAVGDGRIRGTVQDHGGHARCETVPRRVSESS